MKTNIENIPEYLREKGLFCLWKYEPGENGRITKVPYNPNTRTHGKSNDRNTFASLNIAASRADGFDGLGIGIFDDIAAIDIDHCFQDGKLSEMAADIVEMMDAYTETSPSGEGLRILFLVPGFQYDRAKYYINNQEKGLEIYLPGMTNKYVTVTGNTLRKCDMMDRTDRLQPILDKYMKRPEQTRQEETPTPETTLNMSDHELLDKAMNAKNGALFTALWNGDCSGYPSHSEADQALCNLLAFWTGRDAARMDTLFRQSGLMREKKWDRKQSGTTYGALTIQKAISYCGEVYTPSQADYVLGWDDEIVNDWMPPEYTQTSAGSAQTAGNDMDNQISMEAQKTPQEAPEKQIKMLQWFDDFMAKVQTETYKPMPTGMPAFDRLLGGGILRQSLVILSAAPGVGKTAFAQQLFETMAAQGTDVIFMNLEMSREQLIARSLSRITYKQGRKGISASDILQGYSWDSLRKAYIMQAADEYRNQIAERMIYNPGGKGTNLGYIMGVLHTLAKSAQEQGKPAPVVVLDYLHLITTDKREEQGELLKKAVAALKGYAIQYDTFVFAISANNRISNNSGIISLASGRDTSAIEYSADYQLSLNFRAFHTKEEISVEYTDKNGITSRKMEKADASNPDHMETLMKQNPRNMYIQVLKNRMNQAGGKLFLAYHSESNIFYPVDTKIKEPGFVHVSQDDDDIDIPFL